MPFKSEKQRKWMWANEPEMAEKWANEEDEIEEFIKSENTIKITRRQLRRIIREASALHAEDAAYERGYEAGYKGEPEAERSIEYLGGYDAGFLDADRENHKN